MEMIVDTFSWEAKVDKELGWCLAMIGLGEGTPEQIRTCKQSLRFFSHRNPTENAMCTALGSKVTTPSAPQHLQLANLDELNEVLDLTFRLMYFHYVLGRYSRMKCTFPNSCCGISSRNLTMGLWDHGVSPAVSVYNICYDHAYVIIPFTLESSTETGVILADPTSDQLYWNNKSIRRNSLRVLPLIGWDYRSDWSGGEDMYPRIIQLSTCFGLDEACYQVYLDFLFKNPIRFARKEVLAC